MKKLGNLPRTFVFFLAIIVVMSGASTVFADSSSQSSSSTSVTTATYGTSTVTSSTYYDGSTSPIDALYNQIIDLRQQEKDLDVTMKAQNDQNTSASKALHATISSDDLAKIKAVQDQNKSLRASNQPMLDQWNLLHKEYRDAQKAKNQKLSIELRLQINGMKTQVQALSTQIKSNEASIKDVKDRVTAAGKKINAVYNLIKPIRQQMTALWNNVRSLEQQKAAAWKVFDTAVNNGDTSGAVQSLTQIVSLKQQIIDAKKQIYTFEQQVGITLSGSTTQNTTGS
jgi:chromosome segregation ATPase